MSWTIALAPRAAGASARTASHPRPSENLSCDLFARCTLLVRRRDAHLPLGCCPPWGGRRDRNSLGGLEGRIGQRPFTRRCAAFDGGSGNTRDCLFLPHHTYHAAGMSPLGEFAFCSDSAGKIEATSGMNVGCCTSEWLSPSLAKHLFALLSRSGALRPIRL